MGRLPFAARMAFAVLMPNLDAEGARDAMARRCRDAEHRTGGVRLSVGIATLAEGDRYGTGMWDRADAAAYGAKAERGTAIIASHALSFTGAGSTPA